MFDDTERGATSVEYAIMVAFIAIVIIGSVAVFGSGTRGLFETAVGASVGF